ncbi:MAG: helix-turn-helix transcriptional regulator [Defluviitaleaceae bacterium]|nr:helix-turn-helix transcriptional regulator [Defluviitaleaceae bacterium]
MPQYRTDILIKQLRQQKGLTQQALASGLCAPDTLSRFERGERVPSKWLFTKLMQRLGEDPEKYSGGLITKSDKIATEQRHRLTLLLKTPTEENLAAADTLIAELEDTPLFAEGEEFYQYFLLAKTTRLIHKKDFPAALQSVLVAIHATVPDYNQGDDISAYLLTYDEMRAFNILAGLLELVDTTENSVTLYLGIIAAIELNTMDTHNLEFIVQYSSILYNTTRQLIQIGDLAKCIEFCDKALDFCQKHGESYFYSLCMINKAHSLLVLGQKTEGTALYQDALSLLRILKRTDRYEIAKKHALDFHGLELE